MRYTESKSTGGAAFTLIELMVAIGVTALLVGLMLSITMNVMGGWNKSSGSLTSGNQARLVLDMLGRDLQGAVFKNDGDVWFAASIQKDQTGTGDAGIGDANWMPTGVPKPSGATLGDDPLSPDTSFVIPALVPPSTVPALEDYRFGKGGVWLRFFTSVPDTNAGSTTVSAPRAVSYQISRAPVVPGSLEYRYLLFRSEVTSSASFAAGYNLFYRLDLTNLSTPLPSPYNNASTGQSAANVLSDGYGPGFIRRPDVTDANRALVLANNVIDFGVRVYTRDASNVLVLKFPTTTALGFAATEPTTLIPLPVPNPAPSSGAVAYEYGTPAVVEAFVRVLTDEGVLQIDNLENGRITGDWWDIALKNSKVFTRRVELNSNGL